MQQATSPQEFGFMQRQAMGQQNYADQMRQYQNRNMVGGAFNGDQDQMQKLRQLQMGQGGSPYSDMRIVGGQNLRQSLMNRGGMDGAASMDYNRLGQFGQGGFAQYGESLQGQGQGYGAQQPQAQQQSEYSPQSQGDLYSQFQNQNQKYRSQQGLAGGTPGGY